MLSVGLTASRCNFWFLSCYFCFKVLGSLLKMLLGFTWGCRSKVSWTYWVVKCESSVSAIFVRTWWWSLRLAWLNASSRLTCRIASSPLEFPRLFIFTPLSCCVGVALAVLKSCLFPMIIPPSASYCTRLLGSAASSSLVVLL